MQEYGDLIYSDDANAARYFFLRTTNDINFFVEDKDKEYEYEEIFDRMFEGKYRINSIFGVGGKEQLKDRFHEFGVCDPESNAINIYLADGDFDILLTPSAMIHNQNFIYLKAYNIETYYIDENAIIEYLRGVLKLRKKEVKTLLNFESWYDKIVDQLSLIFLTHCFVQKYCEGIVNVQKGPGFFIDEKTGFERQGSYDKYINEIVEISGISLEQITTSINEIKNTYIDIYGDDFLYLLCGKYLLFSLYNYILGKLEKKNLDSKMLKWDLIRNFDISKLNYLKETVSELISISN